MFRLCCLTAALAAACASGPEAKEDGAPDNNIKAAEARLEPAGGSMVTGIARFQPGSFKRVTLVIDVHQLPPGRHAVHLHEKGDCSAPDGMSAGEDWNPTHTAHGHFAKEPYHLGDIENLEADAHGNAHLTLTSREWTIGTGAPSDVLGKAVVIHEAADDFTSQPSGNSGNRIACGVIEPERAVPAVSARD